MPLCRKRWHVHPQTTRKNSKRLQNRYNENFRSCHSLKECNLLSILTFTKHMKYLYFIISICSLRLNFNNVVKAITFSPKCWTYQDFSTTLLTTYRRKENYVGTTLHCLSIVALTQTMSKILWMNIGRKIRRFLCDCDRPVSPPSVLTLLFTPELKGVTFLTPAPELIGNFTLRLLFENLKARWKHGKQVVASCLHCINRSSELLDNWRQSVNFIFPVESTICEWVTFQDLIVAACVAIYSF